MTETPIDTASGAVKAIVNQFPLVAILIYGIERALPVLKHNTEVLSRVLEALSRSTG
jgi:hypothetical protein